MRVLIVDGSERIRARLAERLSLEAVVIEATAIEAALDAASSVPPDVVILDVHLDANTGVMALRRLRAAAPKATIIVFTNEANDVHRGECMRHGADVFLDKSYDFERVVELASAATRR